MVSVVGVDGVWRVAYTIAVSIIAGVVTPTVSSDVWSTDDACPQCFCSIPSVVCACTCYQDVVCIVKIVIIYEITTGGRKINAMLAVTAAVIIVKSIIVRGI